MHLPRQTSAVAKLWGIKLISRARKIALLSLLIGSIFVGRAYGDEHTVSPNHHFEVYTTRHYSDCTGMRLFLRAAGSSEPGVLLRENERWIRTAWSPDSRFLAVIDGSDGHVTAVFVYQILPSHGADTKAFHTSFQSLGEITTFAQAPLVVADLCYHTPNPSTYDVQWDVIGWDTSQSAILLTKRSRAPKPSTIKVVLSATPTRK